MGGQGIYCKLWLAYPVGYDKQAISRMRVFSISAFSLAELMVAIGILGIGMLIIATAFPIALDQTRRAIELQRSQMVFAEAVNKIKTKISQNELEVYITDNTNGANSATYSLGSGNREDRIWILDFDNNAAVEGGGTDDFFDDFVSYDSSSTTHDSDILFTQDTTYAWLAACKRISAGYYLFWIFTIREPSGLVSGTSLKFELQRANATPTPAGSTTKRLSFTSNTPPAGTILLGDDGGIYSITDTSPSSTIVACNRNVYNSTTSTGINNSVAYPVNTTGTVTRKAPTIKVYQTIINY